MLLLTRKSSTMEIASIASIHKLLLNHSKVAHIDRLLMRSGVSSTLALIYSPLRGAFTRVSLFPKAEPYIST